MGRRALCLLVFATVAIAASPVGGTATAACAPLRLSAPAALNLCRHQAVPPRLVTVTGYYRSGPSTFNGPMVLTGAIFERNAVPKSAAKTLHALLHYHGLGFSVGDTSPVERSPVLDRVRDYSRLSISGRLTCMGWSGIRPTEIRIGSAG